MKISTGLLKAIRFADWWDSKIPGLLMLAYACLLISSTPLLTAIHYMLLLLVWLFGAAGLGYYLNNVFDARQDAVAGKENLSLGHSLAKKLVILAVLLILVFFPWFLLRATIAQYAMVLAQLILFLLYSAPPFRLKERYWTGILVDATYAHILPAFIVLSIMIRLPGFDRAISEEIWLLFCCWTLLQGVRNILTHQLYDYDNDRLAGVKNVVEKLGHKPTKQWLHYGLFPLEYVVFLGLIISVFGAKGFPLWGAFLIFPVFAYFREVNYVKNDLQKGIPPGSKPYDFAGGIVLNEFYHKWSVFILLMLLALRQPLYWYIFVIHHLLFFRHTAGFFSDLKFLFASVLYSIYWLLEKSVKETYFQFLLPLFHALYYFVRYKVIGGVKHLVYWYIYLPVLKHFRSENE